MEAQAAQDGVLLRRAELYANALLGITLLFMLVGLVDWINTRAVLGEAMGLLMLVSTLGYRLLIGRVALRPLTLGFLLLQTVAVCGAVHNAGGFLSNLTALYVAMLLGVGFVLGQPRWNIAATLITALGAVTLAVLEMADVLPDTKPGAILLSTSVGFQIFSLTSLVLLILGVGWLVTVIMGSIQQREQELEQSRSAIDQRRREAQNLTSQLEQAYTDVQIKEDLLRQTVDALTVTSLPLRDGVLALPLIGVFDDIRAAEIQERVLEDVRRLQAHTVIIDLTGIGEANAALLWMLGRLINGTRLLGGEVILAGLQPAVARSLVKLRFDRSRVRSVPTLAQAIDLV